MPLFCCHHTHTQRDNDVMNEHSNVPFRANAVAMYLPSFVCPICAGLKGGRMQMTRIMKADCNRAAVTSSIVRQR